MGRIVDLAELGRLWVGDEDLVEDGWDLDDDDENEDELEEDYGPVPCDGSVCCPCGSCDPPSGSGGVDTPPWRGEQHRRPSSRVSAETVGPDG